MDRIFLIRPSCQDKSVFGLGGVHGEVHLCAPSSAVPKSESEEAEHSPGNRNAGVSTGDHAVFLLGVDHGGVNCQRGSGVDYWPGSVGNKEQGHQRTN